LPAVIQFGLSAISSIPAPKELALPESGKSEFWPEKSGMETSHKEQKQ